MNKTIKITFITPCFCRGADCSSAGEPEIRAASIRGQLHWWFRALGGKYEDENAIFGSVYNGSAASKVVIRVKYGPWSPITAATLPHKSGGAAASKSAVAPGGWFELLISDRLGSLQPVVEKQFERALDGWLLLGALGLRATRGGGNFSYAGQPETAAAYQNAIEKVTRGTPFKAELAGATYNSAEDARKVITDTLQDAAFDHTEHERDDYKQTVITDTLQDAAFDRSAPLGRINPRKTSPLRFRIVKLASKDFRIVVGWDGRENVTSSALRSLKLAAKRLTQKRKPIGAVLSTISFIRD